MEPLTPDQLRPDWRIDPDDGTKLAPGILTRRELAEWLGKSRTKWTTWAFSLEPPDGENGWSKTESAGWMRRKDKGGKA